jgi:hypothetical protein
MTAWNDFVKKIYHEGHNKDSDYSFKQALKDASSRKSEMGKPSKMESNEMAMGVKTKSHKKSRKTRKTRKSKKHTKKHKTHRRHRK